MRIFVSYRRDDLGGHAEAHVGRLYDKLVADFGKADVFVDAYAIPAGRDFDETIRSELHAADVMLVVIGPEWEGLLKGRQPASDYVQIEIAEALAARKPLLPILIGGASMPAGTALPPAIDGLHRSQAVTLGSGPSFAADIEALLAEMARLVPSSRVISGGFEAVCETANGGNVRTYRFRDRGRVLSYWDVLDLWEGDPEFCDFFLSVFRQSGFASYVWETPPITTTTRGRDYEQVLHNQPRYAGMPNRKQYARYFDPHGAPDGIVAFDNLGGDTLLIVPSPMTEEADYGGLPEFLRDAPIAQQRGLWRELARHAKRRLSDDPIWISVAGGGIRWLHLRLDPVPKYYRHAPYRTVA